MQNTSNNQTKPFGQQSSNMFQQSSNNMFQKPAQQSTLSFKPMNQSVTPSPSKQINFNKTSSFQPVQNQFKQITPMSTGNSNVFANNQNKPPAFGQ